MEDNPGYPLNPVMLGKGLKIFNHSVIKNAGKRRGHFLSSNSHLVPRIQEKMEIADYNSCNKINLMEIIFPFWITCCLNPAIFLSVSIQGE